MVWKAKENIIKLDEQNNKLIEEKTFNDSIPYLIKNSKSLFLNDVYVFLGDIVYDADVKIALIVFFKSDALQSFFASNKGFRWKRQKYLCKNIPYFLMKIHRILYCS